MADKTVTVHYVGPGTGRVPMQVLASEVEAPFASAAASQRGLHERSPAQHGVQSAAGRRVRAYGRCLAAVAEARGSRGALVGREA